MSISKERDRRKKDRRINIDTDKKKELFKRTTKAGDFDRMTRVIITTI
ncbi:hypothetical protein [Hippea alviniae]|nr:hypothetical protein [Hippea alviniae]